jgi:hypothetical protein
MWKGVFERQKGFWREGEYGQDIGTKGYFSTDEARELLWDHTMEAIDL